MSSDYSPAELHEVPRSWMFNSNAAKAIVLHKTGGDATVEAVYNTFLQSGNPDPAANQPGRSVHYAVGQDGRIWQFVPEALGAGGNGGIEAGYDPFWEPFVQQYGDLNLCTFSIEHCDPALDNSTPLTPAQADASFRLVAHLVEQYGIPLDHIKGHNTIDPIDRAHCPGNYPWSELMAFLKQPTSAGGGSMQQQPYSPHSKDFGTYFEEIDSQHWRCTSNGAIVQDAVLATYQQLSLDGQTLPIVGLPLHNEIYLMVQGKKVALAIFERAHLVYDPEHVMGSQPGFEAVYLLHVDEPAIPPGAIINVAEIAASAKLIEETAQHVLQELQAAPVKS
jgi:hypothetical protein